MSNLIQKCIEEQKFPPMDYVRLSKLTNIIDALYDAKREIKNNIYRPYFLCLELVPHDNDTDSFEEIFDSSMNSMISIGSKHIEEYGVIGWLMTMLRVENSSITYYKTILYHSQYRVSWIDHMINEIKNVL